MKRIATPMVGGVVTSAVLELLIYPVIYVLWRSHNLKRKELTTSQSGISPNSEAIPVGAH